MTLLFGGGKEKKEKQKKEKGMGWGSEDADERLEAEGLRRTELDDGRVELFDTDKTVEGVETYDEDTGELEGRIILDEGKKTGLLALVKIIENVDVSQDHDVNIDSVDFEGKLNVENPSKKDRLWDIDLTLENIEGTDLDEKEIKIRELGTDEDSRVDSRDFELAGDAKNLLLVKEYINSLPNADSVLNRRDIEKDLRRIEEEKIEEVDEEYISGTKLNLESFAIPIEKENPIYFAIAIKNLFNSPIKNIELTKEIPGDFLSPNIIETSAGYADIQDDEIVWKIEEKIQPDSVIILKFSADVYAESIDKINTGQISIKYEGTSSFAKGLKIGGFDAYTRNRFYIDAIERDKEPDVWDCNLVFHNTSEFILQLLNADVYAAEDYRVHMDDEEEEEVIIEEGIEKFVDVDPKDVPPLPEGARWFSNSWEYESTNIPRFRKLLEFRVMPDFQTTVNGNLSVSDVELYVASITGNVVFSRQEEIKERELETISVPTFKKTDVFTSLMIENNGSAPLNELKIIHKGFDDEFKPPEADEVTLIWDESEIDIKPEAINIGYDSLELLFEDLKDAPTGMFDEGSIIEVKYPIHCMEPAREAIFESEVIYTANTLPVSQEIEFIPEVPSIEAVHKRRKFRVGKEVMPIGKLGNYEIILSIENIGDMQLENLVLMDKVPEKFEYGDYSKEPDEVTDEVGEDTLKWTIDTLEPAEKMEISYEITGSGEYHPSDAQLAL